MSTGTVSRERMNTLRQESKLRDRLVETVRQLEMNLDDAVQAHQRMKNHLETLLQNPALPEADKPAVTAGVQAEIDRLQMVIESVERKLNVAVYELDDFETILSELAQEDEARMREVNG